MRTHLIVGNRDLTDYIVENSYEVNAEDVYESWKDGNMIEHRIIVTTKVKGKFKIVCAPDKLTIDDFINTWNSAVVRGVVTLGLYVTNKNTFEALECYYEIQSAQHIKSTGGTLYDVFDIEVTQR